MSGSLIQWLRDNLGMLTNASESEALATSVEDSGGCYVVPAFSGLFAPHWRSDARGVIVGLTRYVNKAHIVRAGFTMQEVLERLHDDYGWSDSISNLSAKLQRESIRYREVIELADVLGYDLVWQKRKDGR